MPNIFGHLNLRQKLICFFVLPLLIIVIVSIFHIDEQFQDYSAASKDIQSIKFTKQAVSLIDTLQKERLYSAQYLLDESKKNSSLLLKYREQTNSALNDFTKAISSIKINIAKLSQLNDEGNVKNDFSDLNNYANKLNKIRQQTFKSDNKHYFTFYTNYIEIIFSTVHQLQIQNRNIEESLNYNELLHFIIINELVSREELYIDEVLQSGRINLYKYNLILNTIGKQKSELSQAAHALIDKNKKLFNKIINSKESINYSLIASQIINQLKFNANARKIRYHLGYIGLLKNYNLNNDAIKNKLTENTSRINALILMMKKNKDQTKNQKQAIECLENYLLILNNQNKQEEIPLIAHCKNIKIETQDIDIAISQILDALQKQTLPIDSNYWQLISNQRLHQFTLLNHKIIDNIMLLSRQQQQLALHVIGLYLGGAILLLLISYWLGYRIVSGLTRNIRLIAQDMQRMTKSPDLKLTVKIEGNDEIAQIADSLNQMLEEKQKDHKLLSQAYVVFNSSSEGIMITNAENTIELINPAFTQITGYTQEDVVGKKPSMLGSAKYVDHHFSIAWKELVKQGSWSGEIYNKNKQGKDYPVHLTITLVKNESGKIKYHIGLFRDVSNQKIYEKEIWKQANFDSITTLPNRHFFRSRLKQELLIAQHHNWSLAMVLIDLDGFKYINDAKGHVVGDELLKSVAERLSCLLSSNCFIARFGGDEFVIIIPKMESHQVVEQLTKKIKSDFEQPFKLNHQSINITASIGVGIFPFHGCDAEILSRNTEAAMFKAKESGRNNITYYDVAMNQMLVRRANMEQHLRRALLHHEFSMYYQPVVNIQTGELISAEALIRWNSSELGFVAPDKFIPLAEETGLIIPIGHWVVEQVLSDLKRFHLKNINIKLALNVSNRQFLPTSEEKFEVFLASSINKHQLNPSDIHIEITESILLENNQLNLDKLNKIKSLGCDIYLDDFGTGYSSLSYLKKFPISVIKIDKSFMDNVFKSSSDCNLVKAIINMGKSLEMPLVAEGVETQEQLTFLQQQGCDFIQGYLVSKPLPFDQFCDFYSHYQGIPKTVEDVEVN